MKIVYCIASASNSGGMERVLSNKANYLLKLGHEIHIVTTDQQNNRNHFYFDPNILWHDLSINYTQNNGSSLIKKILSYIGKQRKHKKALKNLLIELKPEIVISMFDHEVSFLHQIRDGSKKILEIHFSRYKRLQYGRKGMWKIIDQWRSHLDLKYAAKYDKFIVLTHEDKQYWNCLSNITVIPNANSFFHEKVAELKAKRVIAVGRLDYQKRFEDLIIAWAKISAKHPDWELAIFGKGPDREKLIYIIKDLKLENTIQLFEPVNNIFKEYMNSSIIAMTSRYEGLPMALLEAQSCGLPLVAYACKCGPRDLIEDKENGFLITEGDIKELTVRLDQLIQDETLRVQMGQKSRVNSMHYKEEIIMGQWISLFEKLVQTKN